MRPINKIIVHCTATPEGRGVTVEEIDAWHRKRGFKSIGYHYVIYLDGSIHKGREDDKIGAHCVGYNSRSLGVCYVGGLAKDDKTPKDTRTEAQKQSLYKLLKMLKTKYPEARIFGHKDFAAKACPCFDAAKEYENL